MGRRRQPAEIQAQRGNPGKRGNPDKIAETVRQSSREVPLEPPAIIVSERAAAYYKTVASMLNAYAFVRSSDQYIVALLAEALADFETASRELEEFGGHTYEAESYVNAREPGKDDASSDAPASRLIRTHPAVNNKNRFSKRVEDLCKQLAMTPGDRYALLERAAGAIDRGAGSVPGSRPPASDDAPSPTGHKRPDLFQ